MGNNIELTFISSPLILESIGRGKGRYYTLSRNAYKILKENMGYERQQSLDKEAIKIRILSILKKKNLSNKEIRQITGMDSKQVQRLMKELKLDGVDLTGRGRGAKYIYNPDK
ncbi:Winged helix-turn-helix DNA-binding [Desulfonispora thiosulfatigenes DSM 11270]|uniref:Winged helix-turn-helix DNA-binding n=1 Tax=Desulfonispora thiosulfatigenes DSM 11270 TaxID=656914 RepID=A0A1W1UHB8_DESTI|nr:hypothetical protein [Desulfonispora thiosulfatigenes]SMB80518.1 Winged helix-turn-helix DNA-binding [Desulfonispora thiosulfatigenes DSM 11270]